MRRATQNDIAKAVNISRSTVQRALNNSGPVEEAVKKKILDMAGELGYKVNSAAKLLAKKRPFNIYALLVIPQYLKIHKDFIKGFEKAVKEHEYYNINLNIIESDSDDAHAQKEELHKIIKNLSEVDGLIIKPIHSEILSDELRVLKEHSIPIVSLDSDIGANYRNFFVGENYYNGGRIVGDLFTNIFSSGANTVQIVTHQKFEIFHDRLKGFNEIINQNRKINILETLNIDSISNTYTETLAILNKHSDIDAIFTTTNIEAVAKALVASGKENIFLCGFDFDNKIKEYINSSVINLTLYQRPKLQGYIAAKKLINFLVTNEVEKNEIFVGFDIVTRENTDILSLII
jgi:LacI family transcriptional regulator